MRIESAFLGLVASVLVRAADGRRVPSIPKKIPSINARDTDTGRPTSYAANYFEQKIDHFPTSDRYLPHTNDTFSQRYYFDDTYYKPGRTISHLLRYLGLHDRRVRTWS